MQMQLLVIAICMASGFIVQLFAFVHSIFACFVINLMHLFACSSSFDSDSTVMSCNSFASSDNCRRIWLHSLVMSDSCSDAARRIRRCCEDKCAVQDIGLRCIVVVVAGSHVTIFNFLVYTLHTVKTKQNKPKPK